MEIKTVYLEFVASRNSIILKDPEKEIPKIYDRHMNSNAYIKSESFLKCSFCKAFYDIQENFQHFADDLYMVLEVKTFEKHFNKLSNIRLLLKF